MPAHDEAKISEFLRRLRDVADADYVAARALWRLGLMRQFSWYALQTIEKYFKVILLFNGRDTRKLGHDIEAGLAAVSEIRTFTLAIPDDVRHLIRRLNILGPDRYFEGSYSYVGDELLVLDKAVWLIRRYCQRFDTVILRNGKTLETGAMYLREANRAASRPRHRFRIFGGYLEEVLERGPKEVREQLVWKNFFYGTRLKKRILFRERSGSGNSTLNLFPDVYALLEGRVKFSKAVSDYFRATRNA